MTEDAPEPQSAQGMAMPAIPGYRVLRELGRGGMATVYLAVQESLGREVALKLLTRRLADDPSAAERFVREARTAARLVHRHIVGVHDVGEHAGQPFLAMEYLPGDTIAGGALPPTQALEIAREIALALDHAHRQGVVHRDIKPENILRRADGSCALADFGIARTADGGGGMTQDGITLGTPHYMSPEQLQGGELDGRSDLYSLGVVLYQLLTGEVPYKGTDGWAVGMQHISAPLPSLPPALARYQPVIDALMAKDPARRPQSGADAARIIEAALGRSGSTPTLAMRGVASPLASMHRRNLGFAVAGLVVLVLLGGWLYARRGASSGAGPPAPATQVAAEPARSIAVLPLVNMSGNPANDYFSDGLAETTLDMLARVPDLKVIARSSSFAFKGKSMDVREIGRKLGAANLLEGSVQQAGDQVRISMQLIRASDGSHLWARTYDRKLADVFHIQDEVAGEVVKALQMALPGAEKSRMDDMRSTNIDAYREYLRGIALLPDRRADQMREAAAHFEKAITIDPAYARAYVSASLAYLLLDQYSTITGDERERVQRYADRALQLAPDLGEAHIARGGLFERAGRWDDAVKEYRRGVQLAPGYATGHQWLGEILQFWYGQSAEAMHEIDLARALDPLSPVIGNVRAFALLAQNRVDEARAAVDAMIAEAPGLARNYDTRAAVHMQRGDMVAALQDGLAFQRLDPKSYGYQTHHCMALLQFNALAAASQCAERLGLAAPQSPDVAVVRARVALVQGKPELAERVLAGTSFPVLVANARLARGDANGALALLRSNSPELFTEAPAIVVGNAPDALSAGTALLRTGDRVRGTRLIQASLSAEKGQPRGAAQLGRSWNDVIAYARLGDLDAAIAALKDGVQSGFFLDLDMLDADPSLASLRADPRFEQTLAPARALARAQLAAARAAGLVSPIQ